MDVMAMQIAQILVAMLHQQEHSATQKSRRTAPQRSQTKMQSAVGAILEEIQPILR
jgi:hypothetical protein